MARQRNPARREELELRALEYLLEHGVADTTMRALAEALGVSTYALVYHFGSKEQLLDALLAGVEARVSAMIDHWLGDGSTASGGDVVRRFWAWYASEPSVRRQTQLRLEIWSLALRHPDRFSGLLRRADPSGQVGFITETMERGGLDRAAASRAATLIVAALLGLQVDLLGSRDGERVGGAAELLAKAIDNGLLEG